MVLPAHSFLLSLDTLELSEKQKAMFYWAGCFSCYVVGSGSGLHNVVHNVVCVVQCF